MALLYGCLSIHPTRTLVFIVFMASLRVALHSARRGRLRRYPSVRGGMRRLARTQSALLQFGRATLNSGDSRKTSDCSDISRNYTRKRCLVSARDSCPAYIVSSLSYSTELEGGWLQTLLRTDIISNLAQVMRKG